MLVRCAGRLEGQPSCEEAPSCGTPRQKTRKLYHPLGARGPLNAQLQILELCTQSTRNGTLLGWGHTRSSPPLLTGHLRPLTTQTSCQGTPSPHQDGGLPPQPVAVRAPITIMGESHGCPRCGDNIRRHVHSRRCTWPVCTRTMTPPPTR